MGKIFAGQTLKVNPEMDFTDNPHGGYRNKNNNVGVMVKPDYLVEIEQILFLGKDMKIV